MSDPQEVEPRPRSVDWLVLLLCAAGSFAIVLIATRWGAGLSIDSMRYLKAGAHLDEALGLSSETSTERLTHYPPLFPAVLAAFRFAGADPWTASRWINASLMAISTVMAGLIFIGLGGARSWLGLWGTALFAISPDLLLIHAMVWSEPLYIALMLSAVLALLGYLTGRHRVAPLLIAAICVGLACLTRYAGGALVAAGTLAILLLHDSTRGRRLLHAILFAAIASAPLLAWIVYNLLSAGTAMHRSIGFHPISTELLRQMARTVGAWWLPDYIPVALRVVLISLYGATGIAALIAIFRRSADATGANAQASAASIALLKLLVVFSAVYVLMLMISISFFDNDTPLDERILSPLFVTGLLFNVVALKCILPQFLDARPFRIAVGLSCIALMIAYGFSSWAIVKDASHDGLMWGKRKFTDPALHDVIASLSARIVLYSNAPRPLAANVGRRVQPLPKRISDESTVAKQEQFEIDLARLRKQMDDGSARVVFFDDEEDRSKMITESEFNQSLRVAIKVRGTQWRIYAGRPRK